MKGFRPNGKLFRATRNRIRVNGKLLLLLARSPLYCAATSEIDKKENLHRLQQWADTNSTKTEWMVEPIAAESACNVCTCSCILCPASDTKLLSADALNATPPTTRCHGWHICRRNSKWNELQFTIVATTRAFAFATAVAYPSSIRQFRQQNSHRKIRFYSDCFVVAVPSTEFNLYWPGRRCGASILIYYVQIPTSIPCRSGQVTSEQEKLIILN